MKQELLIAEHIAFILSDLLINWLRENGSDMTESKDNLNRVSVKKSVSESLIKRDDTCQAVCYLPNAQAWIAPLTLVSFVRNLRSS